MLEMQRQHKYVDRPKRQAYQRDPYGLPSAQWNDALKAEVEAYRAWRTKPYDPTRNKRLQQRPTTFEKSLPEFESYFGYLVNIRTPKMEAAALRLRLVANVELVREYCFWHIESRTGGPSRFMQKALGHFYRVARYYLAGVPQEDWATIDQLRKSIDPDVKRDKREVWNSLAVIEQIGLSEYPGLAELAHVPATSTNQRIMIAIRAQRSLIIRLMVRRPLRSRNIREMKLHHNLRYENGRWLIEFRGDELKVGRVHGRVNLYRIPFPEDLVPQLEEFLSVWRPMLPGSHLPELFTAWTGRPFVGNTLGAEFKKTIFAYTGRATNIHLMRDIWVTEFLERTQDFPAAAEMLGDTIETVLRHYAHLRRTNAGALADRFIAEHVCV